MRKSLFLVSLCGLAGATPLLVNCSSSSNDGTGDQAVMNANVEYIDCGKYGIPGLLPKDPNLSELENQGRCTWVLSTATVDQPITIDQKNPQAAFNKYLENPPTGGTEHLFTNTAHKNGTIVPVLELLGARSEAERDARWTKFGLMNDPGCKASDKEDEYGLQLDACDDPFSAGAIGARKFPNPAFTGEAKAKWMQLKGQGRDALMKAYETDPNLEPPYLVGQTCGLCHTSFDPAHPPANPARPKWENLKFSLGNQYFREGEFFKPTVGGPGDFRYHVLDTQEPGTSDTSRFANDHVNNPNAINQIFSLLYRPFHVEKLKKGQITFDLTKTFCPDLKEDCTNDQRVPLVAILAKMNLDQARQALQDPRIRIQVQQDGEEHPVQSILKGGEDSVGPVGALLRVYINIGMCSEIWLEHFDPVNGIGPQRPLLPEELYGSDYGGGSGGSGAGCVSYQKMLERVPGTFLFLARQGPIYLKDVPGGAAHIDQDAASKGALVFAKSCASCHSSKQPPAGADPVKWFTDEIQKPDWLAGNYLSDDASHPVTELGTNIARAMHSNHSKGHIWSASYASQSFDERQFPGPVSLENPYDDETKTFTFNGSGENGPGYYRTPTLIGIWTHAPFFHNKALGEVDTIGTSNDGQPIYRLKVPGPGVDDRVRAFEAAADMLLNPDKRPKFIKRTSDDSVLDLGKFGLKLNIPKGTPVNLFASLDPNDKKTQLELGKIALLKLNTFDFNPDRHEWFGLSDKTDGTHLLELSTSPDLVENRGHEFGKDLSDEDKRAVIEYLKTL